jgi:cyclopropane fatty-acyl-phospholipid synthase-like methyltransferase
MTFSRSLFALVLLATSLHAQTPRPTSTPYAGDLSIFEEPGREDKLQINRVMDILHITPGKAVADIGAGGGWFTVRAARRVGESGKVYGEDINPAAVKAIEQRAEKEHLPQVHAVLGTTDDPKLPAKSVDAVLMLKVYHEIGKPLDFLAKLKPALAPGARIGIIDRNGNGADHGLKQSILEDEMREAGFREVEHYDFTKADGQDYFLVFEAR